LNIELGLWKKSELIVGIVKKKGTKANPLTDFISKGKLNVNMGRSCGNPKMKSFGSTTCFMNLPHEMRISR